ncbi:hypothetical protein KPSA1_06132 [Pseudomonas syringae pv. actinidiae]|uniref:Uncharacterized protein n=1 Tax=Pseudomonas syringae pv. actinidiae TaxID=103796 RepID=A0A2V0QI86_PSESF|nr:hypothetical protein KPSA1_06132 [Pseudomonas syringae pv. actinidiae]
MAWSSARRRTLLISKRRVIGSKQITPRMSLMKPGNSSRPPPTATIRPSSISWAGNSPRARLSRARSAVANPATRITNSPSMEVATTSRKVQRKPIDIPTRTSRNSSSTGNNKNSSKKTRIK